ncbi:MAG: hypothetical protein Aureis2KO_26250 [Aureisphaera sp.]
MQKIRLVWLVVCIGMVSTVCGHNPNQIGYNLNEEDQSLTIQFTLRSALDLVEHICPGVKGNTTFQFSDYYQDITTYFNSEIQLQINNKSIQFQLDNASLNAHDAFLKFNLDPISNWKSIEMTVDSYTEVYRRTKNIVKIACRDESKKFLLSKKDRHISYGSLL